jgi:hypothetical protein
MLPWEAVHIEQRATTVLHQYALSAAEDGTPGIHEGRFFADPVA